MFNILFACVLLPIYLNTSIINLNIFFSFSLQSPELLNGKKYGFSTDIWSLGILMIQLIDGTTPTSHLSTKPAEKQIKAHTKIRIKKQTNVNTACIDLIHRSIIFDPNKRISASEVLMVN